MTSTTGSLSLQRRMPRRKAFRVALALAETTQTAWAASQGLSPEHVGLVLSGKRESARLLREIDAFITTYLPEWTT